MLLDSIHEGGRIYEERSKSEKKGPILLYSLTIRKVFKGFSLFLTSLAP